MTNQKLSTENLNLWFDYNLDSDNRVINMSSINLDANGDEAGVDAIMATNFIKCMHVLNKESKEPITIYMNNPGGDWYHGMAIYDMIKTSPSPCTIIVLAQAMSMGSVILQAASNRVMMPNSKFMMHYGSATRSGHEKIFERWADEGKRTCWEMENIFIEAMLKKEDIMGEGYLEKVIEKIFTDLQKFDMGSNRVRYRLGKHKAEDLRIALKDMLNFDTILNAEQTVALGFADSIFK